MGSFRVPLRTAVIWGVAYAAGVTAGTVSDAAAAASGHSIAGLGSVATVTAAVWMADKLDRLIDDPVAVCSDDKKHR